MVQLIGGEWGRALLLEYVFLEVATVLMARRGIDVANDVTTRLLEAREVDFVPCSDLFLDTLDTFRRQSGSVLSFTDAAIVTLARRPDVGVVATFDGDFRDLDGVTVVPN